MFENTVEPRNFLSVMSVMKDGASGCLV